MLSGVVALASPAAAAEWQIMWLDGARVEGAATIAFGTDGSVWGTTGCNRFNATGAVVDGRLVIAEPIATTRMACPGETLTRQEDTILAALAAPLDVSYDMFSDIVTLAGGETTLALVAGSVASGADGRPAPHLGRDAPMGDPPYLGVFGLADDLPLRAEASEDAARVAGVPSGTVLRNDGCTAGWCRVELPEGSAGGWADAQYLEPADSVLRAGAGIFDATGAIDCARGETAQTGQCVFGVARDGNGSATVIVDTPDGIQRALFFRDGAFVSTDATQAAGGFDARASRAGDLTTVRIDDERYEIPDAVLYGG